MLVTAPVASAFSLFGTEVTDGVGVIHGSTMPSTEGFCGIIGQVVITYIDARRLTLFYKGFAGVHSTGLGAWRSGRIAFSDPNLSKLVDFNQLTKTGWRRWKFWKVRKSAKHHEHGKELHPFKYLLNIARERLSGHYVRSSVVCNLHEYAMNPINICTCPSTWVLHKNMMSFALGEVSFAQGWCFLLLQNATQRVICAQGCVFRTVSVHKTHHL